MTTQWEKVHVFISSTFNDMHAERDYLVKQVFPELREWCEERKLRLVDIDLRWGVTEQDALHNKSVVKVCLDRIDDCRPFFVCFLGQRRGWVPAKDDISGATLEEFPGLSEYVGGTSVTEMEILHAFIDPLQRNKVRDPKKPSEFYEPARYAFFYLRDDSYLQHLPNDPPQLRQTYTNEGEENERVKQDAQLKQWRDGKIPATGRPARHYQARWDAQLTTPELLLPLQCPSSEPTSLRRWQMQWAKAGIDVTRNVIAENSIEVEKARGFNHKLTAGRLTDFQSDYQPLNAIILHDLKEAIAARYPDHTEVNAETDLQKEIDQQEQFLFISSEGFIRREGDFNSLDAYVDGDSNQLYALTANGGVGKSTLLANWIEHYRIRITGKRDQSIHFRFIGQSDRSTTVYSILHLLLREMKELSGKFITAIPDDPQKLRQDFPKFLEAAGKKGKTVIVLDALNQLESGLADLEWLPYLLPTNVKLIVSFKRGDPEAEQLYLHMKGQALLSDVKPFIDLDDRRKLVKAYLSQYLKDLDESHLETLIQSAGADNPLFLKVVLSELRVFGVFVSLGEKIRLDFGETPVSAFQGMFKRLENDPAYSPIYPKQAVSMLFGLLSHTRQGLSGEDLTGLLVRSLGLEDTEASRQAASDCVYLYLRQVRQFLAYRDGSYDFFFESFKLAAQERYVGEGFPQREPKEWHRLLAEYFASQPLKSDKEGEEVPNYKNLSELTYHQAHAGLSASLIETLTNLHFMQASIATFGPYKFIDDYKLLDLPLVKVLPEVKENLLLVRDALQLSAHILLKDATQLSGQLIGRLQSINTPSINTLLVAARAWWGDKPWICPSNVHFTPPGGVLLTTLTGEIGGICLYALPDGKNVLTISNASLTGRTVRIWDIEKRALIKKVDDVSEAAITPDGRRAALFFFNANKIDVKVLDLVSMKETQSISGKGGTIIAKSITQNGMFAVTVSNWGSAVKVWDLKHGQEKSCFFTSQVKDLIPFPNGRLAILPFIMYTPRSYSANSSFSSPNLPFESYSSPDPTSNSATPKTIRVWDMNKRESLFEIHQNGNADIMSFIVTPDGKTGISHFYKQISVWNMENGATISNIVCPEIIDAIILTLDGKRLISSGKGLFQIWDLTNGKELNKFKSDNQAGNMAIGPDGKTLAASSANDIEIWNFDQGKLLYSYKSSDSIRKIYFSSNGEAIIIETLQKSISTQAGNISKKCLKALELKAGKEIYTLKAVIANSPIVITPDRRRAASVILISKDGKEVIGSSEPYSEFIVWDLENGEVLPGLSGQQTDGVDVMAITSDGLHIISGSHAKSEVKVWNIDSGNESRSIPLGNVNGVNKIVMSTDGQHIISESNNFLLNVWDLEQGRDLHSIFPHQIDYQFRDILLTTPDGRKAITISREYGIKIWDLFEGKEIHIIPNKSDFTSFSRFLITPDGNKLISISGNEIKIWDIQLGSELFSVSGHAWASRAFAIDSQNLKLVAPNQENLIVTDVEKGNIEAIQTLGKVIVFPEHNNEMAQKEPILTPEGQLLAIKGRQIEVWDLKTGAKKNTLTADGELKAIALSPDRQKLFSSSNDTIQVWNMSQLNIKTSTMGDIGNAKITKIIVTPDGKKAISGSNAIKVWDLVTGENMFSFPASYPQGNISVSSDGSRLICDSGSSLKVIDLENGKELFQQRKDGSGISISPDGKSGLWMQWYELILWELENGGRRQVLKKYDQFPQIDKIKITPDAHRAIITQANHKEKKYSLSIWDLQKGEELCSIEGSWILSIEATPNSKRAVTVSFQDIKVWNLDNGKEMHSFDFRPNYNLIQKGGEIINPDGKTILSLSESTGAGIGVDKIWDLESGKELLTANAGENIAFLSNGKQAMFSSFDSTLRATTLKIRDLVNFETRIVLEGSYNPGQKIVVTPNSRFAISIGLYQEQIHEEEHDRLVEAWDLRTGKKIASLFMDSDISAFSVSPDGRTIIAGDVMGQVHFLRLEGALNIPELEIISG